MSFSRLQNPFGPVAQSELIDRRDFLRVAAASGAGLLVPKSLLTRSMPVAHAATPTPSGRLVYAIGGTGPNLDPAEGRTVPRVMFYFLIFDTLTYLDPTTGAIMPWLAESWRVVSERAVEFRLRRGILFHNGRELQADDVKFTIDRLLDPQRPATLTAAATIQDLERADVVDSHTIRVTAKEPNPFIPVLLNRTFILPAAEFKAARSVAEFARRPIGTGPFQVRDYVPESHIELVSAERSWRKPRMASVRFQALRDDASRVAALLAGQVDIIDGVRPDQIRQIRAAGLKVSAATSAANYAFDAYGPPDTPHAKLPVRRAILHAIDWESILKKLFLGYGRLGNGLIGGPGAFGWTDDPPKYPYNPAKAKELLTAAGYPNGFKTVFQASQGFVVNDATVAEAITGYLRAVNIDVELKIHELATFVRLYRSPYRDGRAPLFAHRQSYEVTMEVGARLDLFDDERSTHPYGWSDSRFRRLIRQARAEVNLEKRRQLLIDANRLVVDQAISYAAMQLPIIVAHSPRVRDVTILQDGVVRVDNIAVLG